MDRRTFLLACGLTSAAAAAGPTLGCSVPPPSIDVAGLSPGLPTPLPGRDRWARMPAAFHRRVTRETTELALTVLDGQLPDDLAGHVFFQSLSLLDSDSGFSGDALIWRIDLDGRSPRATSRLLRTTDYELGRAVADTPLRFESRGMLRLGPLGIQNQTNTALVRLEGNRLLATIDGGRPWELDPATLRPVTPVGRLQDYRPMAESPQLNRFLCPMTVTTAHPPYDERTGEYYGICLSILPLPGSAFTDVLCWDGAGEMRRVALRTPAGAPVSITQSAHQLCVSRRHLVIAETGSTIEYGKLLNPPGSWAAGDAAAPRPWTTLYFVDRDELRSGARSVVARPVQVPREAGHVMVDHDEPQGRVVVHIPHTCAGDFAEWLMPYDRHALTGDPVRPELVGVPAIALHDLGVIARYEIDPVAGKVVDATAVANDWTWGTGGLTAANPLAAGGTTGQVVHANSGFPTDLAMRRTMNGFRDYEHRLVPLADLPWDGVPSSLVRVDHDAASVLDGFHYPGDRFGWTPTFVPRDGTATGASDGYVVAVVYSDHVSATSSGTELWVFDAADLAAGPVVRLGSPQLEMPMSLHSLWTDTLRSTRPDYEVDVAAELTERAATWWHQPEVAAIVRDQVLPAYAAARA